MEMCVVKTLDWTEEQDQTILKMHADGKTWREIAAVLNISRTTVTERGHKLKLLSHDHKKIQNEEENPYSISSCDNRHTLKTGHPLTWGLISKEPFPTI